MTRRKLLGVMAGLPFLNVAQAANTKNGPVDKAMERGADYLFTSQQPNGALSGSRADTMTALGIMALASMGHQLTDPGKYGRVLRKALGFILRGQPTRLYKNNPKLVYFGTSNGMYEHGITTLCLTEMLGMGVGKKQETRLREVCKKTYTKDLRPKK